MTIKTNPEYKKHLQALWVKNIKVWFGWGSWKQTLTTYFILLGSLLTILISGKTSLFTDEITIQISALLATGVWLLIVAFLSYSSANCQIYAELKQRLEKWEYEKVQPDRISLVPGGEWNVNSQKTLQAFIEVVNNEDFDLTNCNAMLSKILVKIDGRWDDIFYKVNPNHKPLIWSHTKAENVVVKSGATGRINIAQTVPNAFSIINDEGEVEALYSKYKSFLEYYVEVVVMGQLNNTPIENLEFHGFIQYFNQLRDVGEIQNAKYRALHISSQRYGTSN